MFFFFFSESSRERKRPRPPPVQGARLLSPPPPQPLPAAPRRVATTTTNATSTSHPLPPRSRAELSFLLFAWPRCRLQTAFPGSPKKGTAFRERRSFSMGTSKIGLEKRTSLTKCRFLGFSRICAIDRVFSRSFPAGRRAGQRAGAGPWIDRARWSGTGRGVTKTPP